MALNLRKAIIRNAVANMTICFVLSIGLGLLSDSIDFDSIELAWPVVLALAIGLFSGWQTTAKSSLAFWRPLRSRLADFLVGVGLDRRGIPRAGTVCSVERIFRGTAAAQIRSRLK